MQFRTPEGEQRYGEVLAAAGRAVVGLDFDGTLAPIVDDPERARIHPDGPRVLAALAARVRAVAIVTGRPVAQVLALGGLDEIDLPRGATLVVRGQYGNERWDSTTRELTSAEPPAALSELRSALPALLAGHGASGAYVEEKGLALAVHTRRLPDPQAALDRLGAPLREAAARVGLAVEPGRMVLELRAPGADKGQAVRELVAELDAGALVFAGDDLGDLAAFDAVAELRSGGLPGLLVCSGSAEETALAERADLVVDGPSGVLGFLDRVARSAGTG